jgi:hypothetical protein
MTSALRALLAALVAALALPAAAQAATVSVANGKAVYIAASGETNRLSVVVASGVLRFEDIGVSTMTAGAGCQVKPGQRIDCVASGVTGVTADLGDGNDWLSAQLLVPATVYGGLGNDHIAIVAGDDLVDGGAGADTIDTGWGDDTIDGGEGADSIGGGFGRDRVVYSGRTAPVSVTIDDVANDGATGEGDNVRASVNDVTGGAGNDTLVGDGGANDLQGGAGDDDLQGGAGDDTLEGGAGVDVFAGGAGADVLRARDGLVETIGCGSEADAAEADSGDSAAEDCELVDRDQAPPPPAVPPVAEPILPPAPTGGTGSVIEAPVATLAASAIPVSDAGVARVRLRCPSEAFEGCAGSILIEALGATGAGKLDVRSARRRKTKLAIRRFKVAAGQGATIPVRLDRRSWRRYRRRTRVKVQVTVTMENATGTTTSTQTVTLRRTPAKNKKRRRGR